jgi:acetyl esterase/lipase
MGIYSFFVTLPMMLLLHLCSPERALNDMEPPPGTMETTGIAYAPGSRHKLDVYSPRTPPANPAPVVVFVYGGAWTTGERASYRYVGTALDSAGMVVMIPDYRLFPAAQFPAFMQDVAQAVAWARANAPRFGGDPHRLFIMGHSAGAQIATLLALDPSYLQAVGLSPADLCGVIGLAGPYEPVEHGDRNMKIVFGMVPDPLTVQPLHFADHVAPSMLLLTGSWDTSVDPDSTFRLAARLRSAGSSATAKIYPDITHHAVIESIATQLSFVSPARGDVLNFIAAQTTCGSASAERAHPVKPPG